ncbi:hypothetical protein G6F45_014014 [Rhizopus arrhizus]|nr:hypothetical protein G6F45_014014 [Rhizopus arrhizus]
MPPTGRIRKPTPKVARPDDEHQEREHGEIEELQRVADGGQQVVELVRQATAEPADRLELLGVAQCTLGIAQQALCLPLLGDVAGDLDEPE